MKRTWTKKDLIDAVNNSITITDTIRKLGLRAAGGNFSTVKRYIKLYNIDTSHFDPDSVRIKSFKKDKTPLEELLVQDSSARGTRLKEILIEAGLLSNVCSICGQEPSWNGKELKLQLDHINGVHTDNRLENLRIVCPNCHTQTDTFAGKIIKTTNNINKCSKCGKYILKGSNHCIDCHNILLRKVERPSKSELINLIENNTWVSIGKRFGVSDNAIKKWAKKYGII